MNEPKQPKVIQVFEHERLTLTPDGFGRFLLPKQLDALYAFNDKNGHKYFTGIRSGVKFTSYVGVIQIGKLIIEILPKADKEAIRSTEELNQGAKKWQSVLLTMLKQTNSLQLESLTDAALKRRNNSLLDLYFETYINELNRLVRQGLVKKYRKEQGNQLALKGRLDFTKNIQQNIIHKERFYVHYTTYDQDHFLIKSLYAALLVLEQIDSAGKFGDAIKRLKLSFPEFTNSNINTSKLESFKFNRKTEGYKKAYQIAKMLLLNYSPTITTGRENMLALLFDMNALWERYVLKQLKLTDQNEYNIKGQSSKLFWQAENVNRTIRPDIVLESISEPKETIIIDTKWKIVEALNPSDDDLKQMFAYNKYWGANKSVLLYPWVGQNEKGFGDFVIDEEGRNQCKLGFVSVLNDKSTLNQHIGLEIMDKL
ncbi:MAG: restriction endonuclease [Bacteroidetes bacterium]|nr:restriction endonuclease [Bacteroidota bacterium]